MFKILFKSLITVKTLFVTLIKILFLTLSFLKKKQGVLNSGKISN